MSELKFSITQIFDSAASPQATSFTAPATGKYKLVTETGYNLDSGTISFSMIAPGGVTIVAPSLLTSMSVPPNNTTIMLCKGETIEPSVSGAGGSLSLVLGIYPCGV